jgi:hypothetical protein
MKSNALYAVAALAAAFAGGASANEAADSQYALKFEGNRTRAEVRAEGVEAARTRNFETTSAKVIAPLQSRVDVQALRAEAAKAVRLGQIPQGDTSRI